jgi:predicted TIM-barrel fold metal-dependent hydrolase
MGIGADYLIAQLDAAGISRAVVLSVAYSFSNPNKAAVPNEYVHVMDENNWTSAQVAKYPHRLLGFCSVNPLWPYALQEIARCARDPNLRTGLKLHFGNSDVNLDNPDHLARVRRVFSDANEHHMAIVVHMHANIDHHRPYGAKEARIFLEQLLPEAPDVPTDSLPARKCGELSEIGLAFYQPIRNSLNSLSAGTSAEQVEALPVA